jgi:hypothetical protein
MSTAATVPAVLAGIAPFSIPLRANLQVLGRRVKPRLADSVHLALVPLANSNIRRAAYFLRRSTEGFQLPRP